MGMIETLDDAENRLLRQRTAESARVFGHSVLAIYKLVMRGPNPRMTPAGSCVLLSIGGHYIMSTAAHVLDDRARGDEIYVAGSSKLVPIQHGMIRTTTAPRGDRDFDHVDCGFWAIPRAEVGAFGDVHFVDASQISPNRAPTDRRYYKAMGYRFSRNKNLIDDRIKEISPARSGYSGTLSDNPELAKALGVSGAGHMFLNFGTHVFDEEGNPANAFSPVGFSGGALTDLGDFTDVAAYSTGTTWRPTLSGMLIEHQPKYKAMIAVRIERIVEGIRRQLPR
jgi:hypothetical protein